MFRTGFVGRQFASGLGAGTVSGAAPSLDLNLLGPTLDSRITFTRASIATYFDSSGVMQTATNNVPRFDYDPVSLQQRGLLIEEARTNGLPNGNAVGASGATRPTGWGAATTFASGGVTYTNVIDNGIPCVDIAVNGTLDAVGDFRFFFTTNTTVAAVNGQTWSASLYMKLISGTLPALWTSGGRGLMFRQNDSGGAGLNAVGININPTATMARVTNVWPTNQATTAYLLLQLGDANTLPSQTINFTLRVGGVQLELGAFPTSYIPTTASAVTRAADVCYMNNIGSQSWFNRNAGTIAADFTCFKGTFSGTVTFGLSDNTFGNSWYHSGSNIIGGITVGSGTAYADGRINKVAATYGPNSRITISTNASASNGGTTSATPPYLWSNRLSIGCSPWGLDNILNGYISRLTYWPRALDGGELQAQTNTPTLDIDLRAPTLDPRITFTRASSGSYFDNRGVLQQAPVNWIRNSTMQGAIAPSTPPNNWSLTAQAALTWSVVGTGIEAGISYVDLRCSGTANATITNAAPVAAETTTAIAAATGQTWTQSVYLRLVAGSLTGVTLVHVISERGAGGSFLSDSPSNVIPTAAPLDTQRFTQTRTLFSAGTNFVQPKVLCVTTNNGTAVDFTVRVGAPQIEFAAAASAFIPTTNAINSTPRLDYDPVTLQPNGLLVEESRTNSSRFGNPLGAVPGTPGTAPNGWSINPGTTGLLSSIIGSGVDGNGISYVDIRFFGTPSANTNCALAFESTTAIAAATGQAWTQSCYINVVGGNLAGISGWQLDIREVNSGAFVRDNFVNFNLIVVPSLVAQRVVGSATTSGGASVNGVVPRMQFVAASNNVIDVTIRIGAMQLEAGAFPTSYIPTSGATATRQFDNPTMIVGPWFSASALSYVVETLSPYVYGGGGNWGYIEFNDSGGNNRLSLYEHPAVAVLVKNGGTTWNQNISAAIVAGAVTKAGIVSSAAGSSATVNGAAPTSNAVTLGTPITGVNIGNVSGTRNGYIRRLRVWPRALSNTELQTATT